jgi:2-C-methyl-D-erythritol 4-phosphate cytidylyltransferase/2-C-methyl-D-erythritol 2,4-cyclodiphosphate synthase
MKSKVAAIIPAAGFGTRMESSLPKQYLILGGIPIIVRTVHAFLQAGCVDIIIVAVPPEKVESTRDLFNEHNLPKEKLQVIGGGKRRQDSVKAGLDLLSDQIDIVMVHDGARPLVSPELICRCLDMARLKNAVIAAVPVKDTLKKAAADNTVVATIDRTALWQAQTPQCAKLALMRQAFAVNGDRDVTDEAMLFERAGIGVTIVDGSEKNIKVTRPEDLLLAETIINSTPQPQPNLPRIGHGYDAHKFAENRRLVLGGVTIPYDLGLAGHSDADVLTHALCDAILGALAAGDIGRHFPDSDEAYAGIYSITLLEQVITLAETRGYIVGNADITLVCEAPKMAPHIDKMRVLVAQACRSEVSAINIKATTTEKMGFTGRKEGIACHAVVILHPNRQ